MRVIMKAIGVITLIGIIGIGCDSITDTDVDTTYSPDVQEFNATAAIEHDCTVDITVVDDIQTAINDAEDGDVICLEAGTYNPSSTINVNKDELTIRGAGPGETIIDADHNSWGIVTANGTSGITLQNFTLTGVNNFALKMQHTENLTIDNVHTVDNQNTGIDLNTVDGAMISNIVSTGTVSGFGIAVRNSEDVQIDNAETSDNAWGGIAMWAPSPDEVLIDLTVTNSTFLDQLGAVVQYDGTFENIEFSNNKFIDNVIGFYIEYREDLGPPDATAFTLNYNNFIGSEEFGVVNEGIGILDATNNWWGHASGPGGPAGRTNPAGNTVGNGSGIAGNVDFNPWLRKSIDHPSNK